MAAIRATMGDVDLTIGPVVRFGTEMHAASEVVTCTGDGARRATFPEGCARATKLAHGLRELGVARGRRDAVVQHAGAPGAVSPLAMGAVLHTPLNFRLSPEQLGFVIDHDAQHEEGGLTVEIISGTTGSPSNFNRGDRET